MNLKIEFEKYQGLGNDFIIIDQRQNKWIDKNEVALIAKLCDRRFGIGADGLMLLEQSDVAEFKMVYCNADGNESTMCGNGGRCIVSFAASKDIFQHTTVFEAIDGLHDAILLKNDLVKLKMTDVTNINKVNDHIYTLNTGSPHFVNFVETIPENIKESGQKIRYNEKYKDEGINVNFASFIDENTIFVSTYERGVEDETLACGTGNTAVALAKSFMENRLGHNTYTIKNKGGNSTIEFEYDGERFTNVWLIGGAEKVFEGTVMINK